MVDKNGLVFVEGDSIILKGKVISCDMKDEKEEGDTCSIELDNGSTISQIKSNQVVFFSPKEVSEVTNV